MKQELDNMSGYIFQGITDHIGCTWLNSWGKQPRKGKKENPALRFWSHKLGNARRNLTLNFLLT